MFGRKKVNPLGLGPHKADEKPLEKFEKVNLADIFLIPVSEIPDKQKQEFLNALEKIRVATEHITNRMPVLYEEENTGMIKYFDVNIFLPTKEKDENVLWYRIKHEGVFNKKIRAFEALTNYRAYFYDLTQSDRCIAWAINQDTDVVVNNQKRISASQREGSFAGIGARGTFVGSTGGFSTGESQTFGDVNLLQDGQIDFTFFSIADPHGLAKLIKHVINNSKDFYKKLEKQDKTKSEKKEINCSKCGRENPLSSKFCNSCGNKLNYACTKCGKINESGSSFCNECGFVLQ